MADIRGPFDVTLNRRFPGVGQTSRKHVHRRLKFIAREITIIMQPRVMDQEHGLSQLSVRWRGGGEGERIAEVSAICERLRGASNRTDSPLPPIVDHSPVIPEGQIAGHTR